MILILDNTVLSNFAVVKRLDLLVTALGTQLSAPTLVLVEFQRGMALERVPVSSLGFLQELVLQPEEIPLYEEFLEHLNAGESACLAIAYHRHGRVLTDDRDARKIAAQRQIPISGTLGIWQRLLTQKQITLQEADSYLQQMIVHGYRSPVSTLADL
jgi:predicted nucleic acid-binding protein